MRRRAFVLKASRRFFWALVSVHEAELYVIIEIISDLKRRIFRARNMRDEVHIDDSFDMVDVGDGDSVVDVVKIAVITGAGAAKVCEVVGHCDRLCSDEC